LSAEARASAEAGASIEVPVLVFFFAAMWSCWNEPRVGAKSVGVGYLLERRSITTAQINEGEASKGNNDQGNGTKIKAGAINLYIQCPITRSYMGIYNPQLPASVNSP
jgi:hypothetical protein